MKKVGSMLLAFILLAALAAPAHAASPYDLDKVNGVRTLMSPPGANGRRTCGPSMR